jgi:hypothetical protein
LKKERYGKKNDDDLEYIMEQSYTSILKKVKACHGSGGDEEVD